MRGVWLKGNQKRAFFVNLSVMNLCSINTYVSLCSFERNLTRKLNKLHVQVHV